MKRGQNIWTGERLETFIYDENTIEHLHRYAIAIPFSSGNKVLDIACGEGYGSNLLASHAESVVGVDISSDTINLANQKYKKPNLTFLEGSTDRIPAEDSSFDLVVSFETIEHHDKHEQMMSEIKRVLKPDGILVISTPDKENYSDKIKHKNEHHVKELYRSEFKTLIQKYFSNTKFLFQRADFFSLIVSEDQSDHLLFLGGDYHNIKLNSPLTPVYIIAVASEKEVLYRHTSVFSDDNIYKAVLKKTALSVQNSKAYKIGSFLLKPTRAIKKIFRF